MQLAHLHATLCLAGIFFQVGLILGLPLAEWAQGAQGTGALPPRRRVLAGLAAAVLLFQALALISAAGFPGLDWPRWTGWVAMGVHGAALALDLASGAAVERRLWAPINAVLAALALAVMTS
ncbi:hypothetical protein [Salipiger mucosus]|uniref:hypothetical protein n=1 Tax=Salipiger mucosus TaxID=263378 RepID=UPI001FE0153F|nr:hypothetical protein [Salipiger mucosus]